MTVAVRVAGEPTVGLGGLTAMLTVKGWGETVTLAVPEAETVLASVAVAVTVWVPFTANVVV